MTSYELARKLLEGEDKLVAIEISSGENVYITSCVEVEDLSDYISIQEVKFLGCVTLDFTAKRT